MTKHRSTVSVGKSPTNIGPRRQRRRKVNQLKAEVKEGKYQVPSDRIAKAILFGPED